MNTPEYQTVSRKECMEALGISEKLFRRQLRSGRIPAINLGKVKRFHMPTVLAKLQKGGI